MSNSTEIHDAPAQDMQGSNVPEFSVSELAFSMKRTLEDQFGHVRVRGELSRVSIAASGHMYSSLKDDNAVIDAVCWKGTMRKLSVQPEEGLEVICTGKISTYPARSNYQLIIESMELAGEGALLKMLEQRKQKLAAEGLFAPERKKKLPFLPKVIGVVTSPTGAVIRDIMHRLSDRFPRHVLLWPALVQGTGAAEQVAKGILGLNAITGERPDLPRPDLIIVARGGGSLEDLMPFNEENVVRAIAESDIPIISAVGHETDTTLSDFAADMRAPTPTGAAEMAVPQRSDLLAQMHDNEKRLIVASARIIEDHKLRLDHAVSKLGDPKKLFELRMQSLDHAASRLTSGFKERVSLAQNSLARAGASIRHPRERLAQAAKDISYQGQALSRIGQGLLKTPEERLEMLARMLETLSFKSVLRRGYVVVRGQDGKAITKGQSLEQGQDISLQFSDADDVAAVIGPGTYADEKPKQKPLKTKSAKAKDDRQETLF